MSGILNVIDVYDGISNIINCATKADGCNLDSKITKITETFDLGLCGKARDSEYCGIVGDGTRTVNNRGYAIHINDMFSGGCRCECNEGHSGDQCQPNPTTPAPTFEKCSPYHTGYRCDKECLEPGTLSWTEEKAKSHWPKGKCNCKEGYDEPICEEKEKDCDFTRDAKGKTRSLMYHTEWNKCICNPGWTGEVCSEPCEGLSRGPECKLCLGAINDPDGKCTIPCNPDGTNYLSVEIEYGTDTMEMLVLQVNQEQNTCVCADGYFGIDCSLVPECNGRGKLKKNGDSCECINDLFSGDKCQFQCNDHGTANYFGFCDCDDGWEGEKCNTPIATTSAPGIRKLAKSKGGKKQT